MKQLTRLRIRPADPATIDELSSLVQRRIADPPPPGSVRPVVRPAAPEDRAAIEEMCARCSPETLRRRFHGPVGDAAPRRVTDLLTGGRSQLVDQLVAQADGAIVGLASLHRGSNGDAQMAVLIEDAWQGSGLGRRLTGHLIRRASSRGVSTIVADVMREPAFVLEHLHRALRDSSVDFEGPIATVRIPVAGAARTTPAVAP
jgi:GNAT superfamily N-acetyltransferase